MKAFGRARNDSKGRPYVYATIRFKDVEESPFIYKEKRSELIEVLKKDIKTRGLLQAVTCYKQGDQVFLADGKHRREAARQHDEVPADERDDEDKDNWMDRDVEAKVYLNLRPEEIPDLVMALDDVRKKAAAGERQVGLALSYVAAQKALDEQGEDADETSVMARMHYVDVRARVAGKTVIPKGPARAIIIANHIETLKAGSSIVGGMVTQRQVPRKAIEQHVLQGKYDLITRQNLAACIQHIVRREPLTAEEMTEGANPRDQESANLKNAFEIFAKEVVIPLAKTDIDQAVGICRRHALDAVGRGLRSILSTGYGVDPDAPLMTGKIKNWNKYRERVRRLKGPNWADPTFQDLRSGETMYKGYAGSGMPEVVKKGVRGYIFPDAP